MLGRSAGWGLSLFWHTFKNTGSLVGSDRLIIPLDRCLDVAALSILDRRDYIRVTEITRLWLATGRLAV